MDPKQRRILMIVENLPVPFDRRVWQEARTLTEAGYRVSIISPTGRGYEKRHEVIEGIEVFRHPLGFEANGAAGYLIEYGLALFWESWLTLKIFLTRGFDVIHACNPPDLIFLVAAPYRFLLGKKFVFDHHDVCPELFLAKFKRKSALYWVMRLLERLTFMSATATIATNDSYREIAIKRGRMKAERVFVVRSGPDLSRMKIVSPDPRWRGEFKHLVGYVGVMGAQEGIQYLLHAAHHLVFERGRRDIKFLLIGDGPAYAELVQLRDK
ncbi:MAG: glycosyltransferase family 4 protein, partial [Alphaproteobacteria bacterium]|nr:glycosyltransferase family 4 protein [Alphaproteobacteria bacterium]